MKPKLKKNTIKGVKESELIQGRLTIKYWNKSLKRRRYEMAYWLRSIASDLENEDPNDYSNTFTAKFIITPITKVDKHKVGK